jgi:hypothetical protein
MSVTEHAPSFGSFLMAKNTDLGYVKVGHLDLRVTVHAPSFVSFPFIKTLIKAISRKVTLI